MYLYSQNLVELLTEGIGLPSGKSASDKSVPESILRSPKSVVAAFLRGLFDADGYAGEQGAILSTKSEQLSKEVQLLLTNFGILTRRRQQSDGCYHVHITGKSASIFGEEIGFGYQEKQALLDQYVDELAWFEEESWTDEVIDTSVSTGTVYDISVDNTHRYAGAGFVNHNSYWESGMMADENFASTDEFLTYADHMARVLGSPGLNPYKLGLELWQYAENTANRREVLDKLLRVEGISWRNLLDSVDFDSVLETLEPPSALKLITSDRLDKVAALPDEFVDGEHLKRAREGEIDVDQYPWKVLTYEGLARRHFSLTKPQHRRFLPSVSQSELERIGRYLFDDAIYGSVDEALEDVEYTTGWDRMREIRESHNDVTFLDEFLTQEFIEENEYFTYEHSHATGQPRVASRDATDVKQKLLLRFTNFGKPTILVKDGNYNNRNELLLAHRYNGVMLDIEQAKSTLERVFELWGRPVNLVTIVKTVDDHDLEVARRRNEEPEPTEQGRLIRYDGDGFDERELPWEDVEDIAASDVDYDTKPDDWLA
ncbi:SpoVR family protein [Natronoarchaeum sp. GCM10025703]|uniref:LAGLIDADG family homing endonuclease n=1 Tax=Natronoarchaeum sp. GCM10025703 TaxID=3252685 RepID=UPI0036178BA7